MACTQWNKEQPQGVWATVADRDYLRRNVGHLIRHLGPIEDEGVRSDGQWQTFAGFVSFSLLLECVEIAVRESGKQKTYAFLLMFPIDCRIAVPSRREYAQYEPMVAFARCKDIPMSLLEGRKCFLLQPFGEGSVEDQFYTSRVGCPGQNARREACRARNRLWRGTNGNIDIHHWCCGHQAWLVIRIRLGTGI